MDCNRYREDLETYADGELDVHAHEETVNHFQSCQPCQDRITQIQQMKTSLERLWATTSAPVDLREKITAALDQERLPVLLTEDETTNRSLEHIESKTTIPVRSGFRRWMMPATIAAAIVIALTILPGRNSRSSTSFTLVSVPANSVEAVIDQHRICSMGGGLLHHDETLSLDLNTIAQRLGEKVGMPIFVPDFSAKGYVMVGANRCGIGKRPGSHILYRAETGTLLSVFTVHRLEGLTADPSDGNQDQHYYVSEVQDTCVVAWHQESESHVLCGKIAQSELIDLIEGVRTASARLKSTSSVLLAEIRY